MKNTNEDYDFKKSFLFIRKATGILGISFPLILWFFHKLDNANYKCESDWLNSISHYYYTNVNVLFVGILTTIGIFLFLYVGKKSSKQKIENRITNFAGILAIIVALFPTLKIDDNEVCFSNEISKPFYNLFGDSIAQNLTTIHNSAAITMFILLLVMQFFFYFDKKIIIENTDLYEKRILFLCIFSMILALFGCALAFFCPNSKFYNDNNLLWLFETIALISFGISWIIKGEILKLSTIKNMLNK